MRVVLVNPPIRLPEVFAHYPLSSVLGLLENGASLRAAGHDVRLVDAFSLADGLPIRPVSGGFRHVGAEVRAVAEAARREAESAGGEPVLVVVAVTMFSDMTRPHEALVLPTAAALRELLPTSTVALADLHVCGMNYFPWEPAPLLERHRAVDLALVGEGEPTLAEIARRVECGLPFDGLGRTAWRRKDGSIAWDPRPPEPVAPLDLLPPPAYDLLDMERAMVALADAIRADLVHEHHVVERQLPLMTSRGCPHRCSFCTNQVLALPYRTRSVGWVRAVVRDLRDRYRVDRVLLLDDNVNADAERFRLLVHMLAEEGVPWDAVNGFRADRLDRETVRAIRAAGAAKITVSAESGDPELLRRSIRKGLKLSAVTRVARICDEERIPLQIHYILGIPGETVGGINRTLELATELLERHGAWPLLQHAIPFPGTRLHRECVERGWLVAPLEQISGARLEVESVIRTPELEPEVVLGMKVAAQHLHDAIARTAFVPVETACDNDCLACGCRAGLAEGGAPSRDAVRAGLELARFRGGREVLLGGGEPTLRADLAEIVAEARGLGFERVALATNAHGLVDRERSRRLAEAGLAGLVVDLHGPDGACHDRIARRTGAFAWSLAGVARARGEGVDGLEVRATVTRSGLDGLAATVRLAVRLGARHVHLAWPEATSPAHEAGEVPSFGEAREALVAALDAAPAGAATVQGLPLCLLPGRPGALAPLPPFALARARPHRARHPRCIACPVFLLCGGFPRPELDAIWGTLAAAPPDSAPGEPGNPVD